ncbi:MAG: hypothetical protein HYY29_06015 [Chloroflexi bacterium]|nr:hypothetical protein [Chloroflexota bacterium]
MTTEANTAKASANRTSLLFAEYVSKASKLPIVKEIMVADDVDGPDIWTIIDAPPLDIEATQPLINTFVKVFQNARFPFDFRFLNIGEYSNEEQARQFIPRQARSIWRRND